MSLSTSDRSQTGSSFSPTIWTSCWAFSRILSRDFLFRRSNTYIHTVYTPIANTFLLHDPRMHLKLHNIKGALSKHQKWVYSTCMYCVKGIYGSKVTCVQRDLAEVDLKVAGTHFQLFLRVFGLLQQLEDICSCREYTKVLLPGSSVGIKVPACAYTPLVASCSFPTKLPPIVYIHTKYVMSY